MSSQKSHIHALLCGAVVATAIVAAADTASAAVPCAAACPSLDTIFFDGLSYDDANSGSVTGNASSGYPNHGSDKGTWVYMHHFTASEVADIALAYANGCWSSVSYSVSGEVLSAGSSMAVVDALVTTAASIGGVETILDASPVNAAAPPTGPVNVSIETGNLTGTLVGAQVGDSVGVRGQAHAFARAIGTTSFDYASANLHMAVSATTGAPILQICHP